jgi:hypothetical protein
VLISTENGYEATDFDLPVFSDQVADPTTCDPISDDQIPNLLGFDACVPGAWCCGDARCARVLAC